MQFLHNMYNIISHISHNMHMHQQYIYLFSLVFKYEPYLCNGCHDLMQKAMNFNGVAIVSVKGNYYSTWAKTMQ